MRTAFALVVFLVGACATPQLGDTGLPERPASLAAAFAMMPAPAKGRVRVLDDNIDAWIARMNLIESARKTLDVQYFIVEPDSYGMALLGLLAEKARAGVKVRLMVDARGSFGLIRGSQRYLLQQVKKAGADVRVYNPILWQLAGTIARGDLRSVVASNHDKMIIADGRAVIAGGRNVSKDYLSDPHDLAGAFIDMDLFYEGAETAARMTEAFTSEFYAKRTSLLLVEARGDGQSALSLALKAMRRWLVDPPFTAEELVTLDAALERDKERDAIALALEGQMVAEESTIPTEEARAALRTSTQLLAREARLRGAGSRIVPRITEDNVAIHVLDTHSAESTTLKNTVNENLILAVLAAEKKLIIQSPYFVLSERGLHALELVAAHGVAIRVLTNSPASSDSPATQAAFLRQWPSLLARVPTARLFVVAEGRLMHAKVGIVDDQVAFIGSYNLDPLSAAVNGEVVGALWSRAISRHVGGLIERRIEQGRPGIVEYRIEKDVDGKAVERNGAPVVVFGPDDHCTPEQLAAARKLEPALELLAPLL